MFLSPARGGGRGRVTCRLPRGLCPRGSLTTRGYPGGFRLPGIGTRHNLATAARGDGYRATALRSPATYRPRELQPRWPHPNPRWTTVAVLAQPSHRGQVSRYTARRTAYCRTDSLAHVAMNVLHRRGSGPLLNSLAAVEGIPQRAYVSDSRSTPCCRRFTLLVCTYGSGTGR